MSNIKSQYSGIALACKESVITQKVLTKAELTQSSGHPRKSNFQEKSLKKNSSGQRMKQLSKVGFHYVKLQY